LKPEISATNDITAFSQTSPTLEGQVIINTPDVDPSKGFVELPTLLAEISEVIDTSCAAFASGEGSKFTVTGRGGLPPSPNEPLSTDVLWTDTRTSAITTQPAREKGTRWLTTV
jgi:large exoprotein involved in heme utilization and adhesion